MTDKAWMKAELLKATENLIDMATEAELSVLGALIDLQLRKAAFIRRADLMNMNAEQLASFRQELIVDRSREVMALVALLEETDTNALQSVTMVRH